MTRVRVLTSDDLAGLAEPGEIVDAVREGYRARGNGAPARPRTRLKGDAPPGLLTGYSAILQDEGAMGGYLYSAGFSAEDAWFVLPLFDAESGRLKALLDGSRINPTKTGAASAVAVDALAREDASVLSVIGSGNQAWGQLRCIATVRDLSKVRVFSPTRGHREAFAEAASDQLGIDAEAAASSSQAVEDADIVVTATRSSTPVVSRDALRPGTHVTAMGQYHPERRELDGATIQDAVYVPDLRDRAHQDSGEFLQALEEGLIEPDHLHAELGEVVAGKARGRTEPDALTVFDSGGTGIETVAAAELLYERAVEGDVGTVVSWSSASEGMQRPW